MSCELEVTNKSTHCWEQISITTAISVFQNNETAAMLVLQTSPVGVDLFSHVNASYVPINVHRYWPRE